MKIFLKVLPALLILSIAVIALIVVIRVSRAPRTLPYDKQPLTEYNRCLAAAIKSDKVDAKQVSDCGQELASLSAADDVMKARMDELRWMLTIIGSLAAFFAIAQGAAAYFSAQNYTKSADEAIGRIDKQEASVRARYPLFEQVERARDDAYTQLRLDLKTISKVEDPTADPLEALALIDRFYGRLPVERRQALLSVESFASADLGGNRTNDEEYASDLVRLAIFYQSKFAYEDSLTRGDAAHSKRVGNICDLERAEAYLKLAARKAPSDFTILNELGILYINFHRALHSDERDSRYLADAENTFQRSIEMERNQQRAYYNTGTVFGRYRKDYLAGIHWLNQAKQFDKWQRLPVPYSSSFIYYNLGCYGAKHLDETLAFITEAHASECLEALAIAAQFRCIPANAIRDDFDRETGDLFHAYAKADAGLKRKLDEMKADLLKPGPPREATKPTYWAAFKGVWRIRHPPHAA